jgi:hypothetical protein
MIIELIWGTVFTKHDINTLVTLWLSVYFCLWGGIIMKCVEKMYIWGNTWNVFQTPEGY